MISLAVDIVLTYEKHVLLVKRGHDPFKDCWAIPGGFVEEGETLKEAAIRELKEETSFDLADLDKLMEGEAISNDNVRITDVVNRDPRGRVISVAFRVMTDFREIAAPDYHWAGMPQNWQSVEDFSKRFQAGDDAKEFKFFPCGDVLSGKVDLAFDHATILKDWI